MTLGPLLFAVDPTGTLVSSPRPRLSSEKKNRPPPLPGGERQNPHPSV
jgi:hypothetical protein